jgi:hypothetical protein
MALRMSDLGSASHVFYPFLTNAGQNHDNWQRGCAVYQVYLLVVLHLLNEPMVWPRLSMVR